MDNLLEIVDLTTEIEGKKIIKKLNLTINKGEIHVIMGPNGAGKSTLAYSLMGHPQYQPTSGKAYIKGENLLEMTVDERAKAGLFLSFQYPEVIPGITVETFLRTAKSAVTGELEKVIPFKRKLLKYMEALDMDKEYSRRYLNDGFSGGEKKKNEILQMLVLDPTVAILDETDSGLDVDAIRIVAKGVREFLNEDKAVIVITHYNKLITYLKPDYVHVLLDGQIVKTGGEEIADEIEREGFEKYFLKFGKKAN